MPELAEVDLDLARFDVAVGVEPLVEPIAVVEHHRGHLGMRRVAGVLEDLGEGDVVLVHEEDAVVAGAVHEGV